MESHQLPIAVGVMLVSAAFGAAVSGYSEYGVLLAGAVAGLLSIGLGIAVAPKPPVQE